jgi:general secretion pathway protein M
MKKSILLLLQPLLQRMQGYWTRLSASEQRTLRLGGWVLLPLALYGLLWHPAHEALPKLQAELPALRQQAQTMKQLANAAQSLRQRAQPAVLDAMALQAMLDKSAREAGLPLTILPGDKNAVRVSADSILFADWMAWLQAQEQLQHVRVTQATLSTTGPGTVKLQATLMNGVE